MKWFLIISLLAVLPVGAIPNQILGGVTQANSPLNGAELANRLLAPAVWEQNDQLPGEWKEENQVADTTISHLLARPKVFGLDAVLVRATHREDALESITVTFADAGSYFPYLTREAGVPVEVQREELLAKQEEFNELYSSTFEQVKEALKNHSGKKAKELRWGASRTLRAELLLYTLGDTYAALYADNGRLLRLTLTRDRELFRKGWLDKARLAMSNNDLRVHYQSKVKKSAHGDILINGVQNIPQGYKPYCGLNSLTMVAQYLGLHLDEDWMAVAGKFQNTGSAAGSNMMSLYNATAKEARVGLTRETKFTYAKARKLIQSGMPVIVWRRFGFNRNRIHDRFSQRFAHDTSLTLPIPDSADRATWPGDDHPVHSSVIVGVNDERKEVLFIESWRGQLIPKRMRIEELESTATMVFYFEGK